MTTITSSLKGPLEVVSPAVRGKHKIRGHVSKALGSIAIKKSLSFVYSGVPNILEHRPTCLPLLPFLWEYLSRNPLWELLVRVTSLINR